MSNVVNVIRMSPPDAVALNEKVQSAVASGVSTYGEQAIGAAVLDAASSLKTSTNALSQIEAASYGLRREVDSAEDRCIGALISRAEDAVSAYVPTVVSLTELQKLELDSARWIKEHCFPEGRGFLKGRWSEQFGVTEMILRIAAQPEAEIHIARLGLANLFDLLKSVHVVYGERMGFTSIQNDSDSPLYQWHESLEAYLAAVIYAHKGNSALRAALLAPYETTAQALREAKKRAQKPADDETEPAEPTEPAAQNP